ncbi:MAG: glycosyltransferase family 39 protein, partial [Chloroflexales bacterium]|nr:glycosyltransferase family 39 protein [Chloroflexales bacterium]
MTIRELWTRRESPQTDGYAALLSVIVFLIALAPRLFAQGRFLTVDEAYHWQGRVEKFLAALRAGDWGGTFLIGHPGVTTMWLGTIGRATYEMLTVRGLLPAADPDLLRIFERAPISITNAVCVALGYLLLCRLLSGRVAFLAALLWATEPFLIAHSQLLHLDALLTSFVTLALLLVLCAFRFDAEASAVSPIRWPFLLAAGVVTGLALLTKSPSLIALPMLALIGLIGAWPRDPTLIARESTIRARPSALVQYVAVRLVIPLLVLVGVALLVWYILWPATWADPLGIVQRIINYTAADGGSPHGWGNFFMGRPVEDPGPLFYPVAIALRLTPWILLGLVAALVAGVVTWRHAWGTQQRTLLMLACFAIFFVAVMSTQPKKFDRYALPVFPSLVTLAAAGLAWVGDLARRQVMRGAQTKQRAQIVFGWGLIGAILATNVAWYHPYQLAYYNQLLGGSATAVRTIPVGWGEGFEQAGAFINAQPDGADLPVASWFEPVLQPYVNAPVLGLSEVFKPGRVGYAVLYIDQLQRQNEPEATDLLLRTLEPNHTVRIHGIDYAYVYQIPRPVANLSEAEFGEAIVFRGYDLAMEAAATTQELGITLHWYARANVTADYMLFIHVLDSAGARIGQTDVPPAGGGEPTSAWQPGSYVSATLRVPLTVSQLPPSFWIAIGLYDPQSGARLALNTQIPQTNAPDDGP